MSPGVLGFEKDLNEGTSPEAQRNQKQLNVH